MYILATDETNIEPSLEGKFFIYGGIIFKSDKLSSLDAAVREIRAAAGYKEGDLFKFDTHLRPSHVTKKNFDRAKSKILELCENNKVNFIAYLIHHKIIAEEIKLESAINHLTSGFNKFLEEKNSWGFCVYDRMPHINKQFGLIRENFTKGLKFKNDKRIRLEKILLHSVSCAGASNISSATDIVLGSFRYCINKPRSRPIAKYMIKKISNMVWGDRKGKTIYCIGKGIILRPLKPRPAYKKDYDDLIAHINSLLKNG